MSDIECRTMKLGGSIGIILPSEIVKKEGIRPNQNIRVQIRRQIKVRDIFGLLPEWKTSAQKLKDEARKGW